jgi:hypothetical protein
MAKNGGMRSGGIADRTRSRSHVVEEWVPSSAWTEDSNGHYLLVDLPGISTLTFIIMKIIHSFYDDHVIG